MTEADYIKAQNLAYLRSGEELLRWVIFPVDDPRKEVLSKILDLLSIMRIKSEETIMVDIEERRIASQDRRTGPTPITRAGKRFAKKPRRECDR